MTKYILEDSVVYDSGSHSLFYTDRLDTQITLAIPASLCLLAMLQKKNETVSLDELLAFAWESRGMTVSSNTIYQNISLLRKSLINFGLSTDFIKTVPKRGFVILDNKFSEISNHIEDVNTPGIKENRYEVHEEKISHIIRESKTRILFFFIVLILTCSTLFLVTYHLITVDEIDNSPYIYPDFTKINTSGGCHIFRNKSLLNDMFFSDFISEKKLKCEKERWMYIINYPPAPQTFVLSCSSELLSTKKGDILCQSAYYY
jgi:DNA-binding winged helix-turn-helix (wHTH) protein